MRAGRPWAGEPAGRARAGARRSIPFPRQEAFGRRLRDVPLAGQFPVAVRRWQGGFPTTSHQMTLGVMLGAECRDLRTILPIRIHRYENARGFGRRAGSIAAVQASATRWTSSSRRRSCCAARGRGDPGGRGVTRRRMGREGVSTGLRFRTGDEHDLPQYGVLQLDPCRIVIEASAGGGWGDPRQRDPQAVLRDVRDGIITLAPRWMSTA